MGRPRSVSPPAEDMIKLGEEMLYFVAKYEPLHLSQWYSIEKMFTYKQWQAMQELPEFLPYYEKAIKMVAIKYLDGTVNSSIAQRFLRVYFQDLREREDLDLKQKLFEETKHKKEILEHDIKFKAQVTEQVSDELKTQFTAIMQQINIVQGVKSGLLSVVEPALEVSDLKIESSKYSSDNKS